MSKNYYIIPIFVPHRGCPNDCVFCNQNKITGLSTDITAKEVQNTIISYLKTIPNKDAEIEVSFFGGSFTGIDINIQKSFLNIANRYKKEGYIDKIRLSTRPDYIDYNKLDLLKDFGVDIIELGVQSLDDYVLKKSNRGHTVNDVEKAVEKIKEYGFKLGIQIMIGLPGDTEEKSITTCKKVINLCPDIVRIYPTLVIKDTKLEKMYLEGSYFPLRLDEAVHICSKLLMMFNLYNINVIRIGLQPTDNISLNKDVVSGPFHPAFRQLVESEIFKKVIKEFFNKNKIKCSHCEFFINKTQINNFIGHKSVNINYIKDILMTNNIKISTKDIGDNCINLVCDRNEINIDKNMYTRKYLHRIDLI